LDLHLDGVPTPFGVPTDAHLDVCDGGGDDVLTESIFGGLDVDIRTSQVWGSIAAGNDLNVETCNLGIGVTDEDTDTMIAERDLNAHIGNLEHGNVVAGSSLNIQPTFSLAGGTLAPRIDNVIDWANIMDLVTTTTTAVGALAPTGMVTVQQDNLIMSAHNGLDVEIFLVTAAQLEAARDVSIDVDAGSAAIVNIEGGNLNPMQFGIRLVNIGPDMVLFNAFEASQVSIADVNFDGSLVVQGGEVDIQEIDVAGQLIAGGDISLQTTRVFGQLFNGEIGDLVPFMAGHPMQEPEDVLLHNLVLSPSSSGDVTVAPMGSAVGSPLAVTVNGHTRSFRADKVAQLTVANVTDHSLVDVDPSLGLDVHFLEEAPLMGADVYMLNQLGVPRYGRGMILMDLFANDLAGSSGLDTSTFRVVTRPEHGVVRYHEPSGRVWFAWGSAKWTEDSFEYLMLDGNGVASEPVSVQILR
jgi:choice-of-anchor A domain-containing protein